MRSAKILPWVCAVGLTSSFAYDTNYLVNTLATPYGTTIFAYSAPGTSAPPP